MNNNPLVSVIIPTYKRDISILSRAVESVQLQSYKNVEIVIIDDNAGEELSEYRKSNIDLVNKLSLNDNRLKLICNEKNLGGALSRNEGIKAALGEYITFLDDDDYFLKDKVLHQIEYMIANDVNFSFTDLYLYDKSNKVIDIRDRSDLKSNDKEYLLKYHIVKNITGTETFMSTKSLLEDIGFFDEAITGHEFYLMIKVLLSPKSIIGYFKSNDIVAYRTSDSSISNGPHKIEGENKIYAKRREFYSILNAKEKRIVRSRHYSVIGVTYLRRKKILRGLCCLALAFLISPLLAFKEFFLKKR